MKKIFQLMAAVAVVLGMAACSDDDDNVNIEVNNGETEVSINRAGGVLEIPIKADGKWTASMQDGTRWADVWTKSGKGDGIIKVNVDYLDPRTQTHERKAVITVKRGGKTETINLRQYIGLKDGESADNASTNPYPDLWLTKGIGRGFDPTTGEMTSDFVLNPKGMAELATTNSKYSTIFTQTTEPGLEGGLSLNDSLESNETRLSVHADISVKYAKFKLTLNVDYDNSGKQVNKNTTYNATQDISFLSSNASAKDAAGILRSDPSFEKEITQSVVSNGFKWMYMDIMDAYDDYKSGEDTETFVDCVNDLCDSYGPYFVSGATLGGSIFISMQYDSLYIKNNLDVSGSISVEVMLPAISIEANISAEYKRIGEDIWKNSSHHVSVTGGDPAKFADIAGNMMVEQPNIPTIKTAVTGWMNSIVSSNNETDNTAVIKMTYSPIWILFPGSVQRAVKNIVVERYKGKKLCSKLAPEDFGFLDLKADGTPIYTDSQTVQGTK